MAYKLHEGEELLDTYRTHELTLAPTVLEVFVLIFVPWYFAIRYDLVYNSPIRLDLFLLWTLLVAAFASRRFVLWWLNYYILTSERLLHIEYVNAFKRTVTETSLDRILNASYKTTGFFSTLFHYGDVDIHAVGREEPFALVSIPNPEETKDTIWQMHLKRGGGTNLVYAPRPRLNKVIGEEDSEESSEDQQN